MIACERRAFVSGAALLAGIVAALAGCGRGDGERSACRHGLCLRLPDDARLVRDGERETVRLPTWVGWLDVQFVRPRRGGPGSPEEAARVLSRRHEFAGNATVHRVGTTQLAGRDVGVEEATIEWRGRAYRRVTYLASVEGGWLAVDETAPAGEFERAHAELDAVLRRARWEP